MTNQKICRSNKIVPKSYLVEQVDDLGEDVEASSRIDGGLVKDASL